MYIECKGVRWKRRNQSRRLSSPHELSSFRNFVQPALPGFGPLRAPLPFISVFTLQDNRFGRLQRHEKVSRHFEAEPIGRHAGGHLEQVWQQTLVQALDTLLRHNRLDSTPY